MKIVLNTLVVSLTFCAAAFSADIPVRFNPDPNPPEHGAASNNDSGTPPPTDAELKNMLPDVGKTVAETTTGISVSGTVTFIDLDAKRIRIKEAAGRVKRYNLTEKTEVTTQQGIGKLTDVKSGDAVSLQLEKNKKNVTRIHISQKPE